MSRKGVLALAVLALCACDGDASRAVSAASSPAADAGERLYREGITLSGEPMTALVGGDIPIIGTQFSCENCHGRSGMGAAEGPYVVPPVAAQFLFEPSPQPERPAYDRDSLAAVLRDGITPAGRVLSPELMPRYRLEDADIDALTAYLEGLSAGNSPGVDDEVIRFATIVTEGADEAESAAVLAVLRRFAEDINRQTRNESGRWDRGYTPESKWPTVFRRWVVDEWTLSGEPGTWPGQLEDYYSRAPVFAIVGGTGGGSWQPISEFCERNRIACLYPSTDLPWRREGDFYTVYFSAGLALEARLIADHLGDEPVTNVVQVYCDPSLEAVAATLRGAMPKVTLHDVTYDCSASPPFDLLDTLLNADSALVLWLDTQQLGAIRQPLGAAATYVSSSMTDSVPPGMPAGTAEVYMAHPFRLPGKADPAMRRFQLWARSREVAVTSPRRQAEAYFACLVLKDAVKHMGRYFIREYALDMLDHAEGLMTYVPLYERASVGPGQRFISKGGYVLPVAGGRIDADQARWVVP